MWMNNTLVGMSKKNLIMTLIERLNRYDYDWKDGFIKNYWIGKCTSTDHRGYVIPEMYYVIDYGVTDDDESLYILDHRLYGFDVICNKDCILEENQSELFFIINNGKWETIDETQVDYVNGNYIVK